MVSRFLWTLMSMAVFYTFSSCATIAPAAPQKPSVEIGVIDYPNSEVVVNITGAKSFRGIERMTSAPSYSQVFTAIVQGGNRVPLATYDRAISFRTTEWQKVQDYLNAMVRFIGNHCSGN